MDHVVGISDMKVVVGDDHMVRTYSLGSCLGLTLLDKQAKVGGMIHCMLPLSKIDKVKAEKSPAMFVDVGVPLLLQQLFDKGASRKNLIVKVAGCGQLLDDKKLFKIGERNYTVLRKILWKNNILIDAEDVGGTKSRTVSLYMETGITTVKADGKELEL
jgi:chemotaxis protein CheD